MAEITVFSITGGVELEGRREARSDGTVAATLQGSGNAGVEFVLGGKGGVESGDGSFGGGVSGEASLVGELTGARTWVFDSPEAADEFIDDVKSFLIENAVAEGVGSVPGGGFLAEWAYPPVPRGSRRFCSLRRRRPLPRSARFAAWQTQAENRLPIALSLGY